MAERLKDIFFTDDSMNAFANAIIKFYPKFNKDAFRESIKSPDDWDEMELKKKMRHTTECLYAALPQDYRKAVDILVNAAPFLKGFEAMSLPDYVELYGLEDWDSSLPALKHFNPYASSEFAIRPFILQNAEKAMAFMNECAEDENDKIRRFASEGCRPRLPWAMALPVFKKDPSLIIPVLEKLKDDPSEFVRRSVANNLNDISKDNPEKMLEICEGWYGHSANTDWIVKHACRSLLKTGNKRALILFGHGDPALLKIKDLTLNKNTVTIGEELHYTFTLHSGGKKKSKVRLEYAMDFVKSSGKWSRKIFKITENDYAPGEYSFTRKHSFADMSTRKHFPGTHQLTLIANGEEKAKVSFEVLRC